MQKVTLAIKQQTLLVHLDSYFTILGPATLRTVYVCQPTRATRVAGTCAQACAIVWQCRGQGKWTVTAETLAHTTSDTIAGPKIPLISQFARLGPFGPGWARLGPIAKVPRLKVPRLAPFETNRNPGNCVDVGNVARRLV